MNAENSKPSPKAGQGGGEASAPDAKAEAKKDDAKSTGRVQFDDKGNAIWQWSISTGAFAREVPTEHLQKLENPALSLAEDAPTPYETVRANPHGTKKGYDPYDSGKLGKTAATPRKKDLRRLSEALQLKKQAAKNQDDKD